MNYEDELERSRARKSRRRESTVHERESRGSSADLWSATAEPGSRASRSRAASAGPVSYTHLPMETGSSASPTEVRPERAWSGS